MKYIKIRSICDKPLSPSYFLHKKLRSAFNNEFFCIPCLKFWLYLLRMIALLETASRLPYILIEIVNHYDEPFCLSKYAYMYISTVYDSTILKMIFWVFGIWESVVTVFAIFTHERIKMISLVKKFSSRTLTD